jgi:hypothetical protein
MSKLIIAASTTSVQLTKIRRVLDSHWVLSSFCPVSAVRNGYSALVTHFKVAPIDIQKTANEHKKYTGLSQCMDSVKFLMDLGLMHEALKKLTNLSIQLQERFCTITSVDKLIKRTIHVVGTLRKSQGKKKEKQARK